MAMAEELGDTSSARWMVYSAKQQPELQLQLFTPDGVKKAQHHQGAF